MTNHVGTYPALQKRPKYFLDSMDESTCYPPYPATGIDKFALKEALKDL